MYRELVDEWRKDKIKTGAIFGINSVTEDVLNSFANWLDANAAAELAAKDAEIVRLRTIARAAREYVDSTGVGMQKPSVKYEKLSILESALLAGGE